MVSRGATLFRWVLPGLLVGLAAALSGCVVEVGDEPVTDGEGSVQSPLNDHIAIPDPGDQGDPSDSQDPEPDPWKGGGRVVGNADPEPDPWHPTMSTAAKGSGSSNNKP